MELREVVARRAVAAVMLDNGPISSRTADTEARDIALRSITCYLSAIQDAGYAIVPVEPTEEMMQAGAQKGDWHDCIPTSSAGVDARDVYKAMIAAFPTSTPSASDE